jgi:putative ABC transport system permease protein
VVTTLKEMAARLRACLRTRDLDRDLEQELESHLTMLTEDNIDRGMEPEEARRAALIRVGNLASLKDRHRDIRGLPTVDAVLQDVRFAGRRLIRDRWFSLAAITALALGIGANSAVFTIVNAVLLRNVPIDHPDRIMTIEARDTRGRPLGVSLEDFADWRRASHTFSGMTLVNNNTQTISADDRVPERYPGVFMSANGFDLIGAKPALGRGFAEAEDRPGAPPVVLLSDSVWKSRYAADPAVIGKSITVQGLSVTIIGVMPPDFKFPSNTELWSPLGQLPPDFWTRGRQSRNYFAYGRLSDGATLEQARSELSSLSTQLAQQYPATNRDLSAKVTPLAERFVGTQLRVVFWSLMGAVAFVLLIACANVANLMLARAAHRAREIAVRVSLGATRWRVVRQLLVESLLLSCISGAAGLGVAVALIRWFDRESRNVGLPYWMVFSMDARVLAFFAAVCLLTGIAFGLAPALLISKTNVNEVIKEGGRSGAGGVRTRRWTAALMVAELTLTLVLLASAGFMMRSFINLYRLDVGVDASRLLTTSMVLPGRKYPTRQSAAAFLRRIDERLSLNGAFEAASTTTGVPLSGGAVRRLAIDGRPAVDGEPPANVTMVSVGPRYFDSLGLRLVRGRPFDSNDGGLGHEVAIVNARIATLYFGTADPVGTRIRLIDDTPAGKEAP